MLKGYRKTEGVDAVHHYYEKPDDVVIDFYKNGDVVVMIERGGKTDIYELTSEPEPSST